MLSEMLSFLLLVSLTAQAFSALTDPRQIHISSTGEFIINYTVDSLTFLFLKVKVQMSL